MRLLNSCRFKKFCSLLTVMLLMLFSVIPASAAELSTDEKAEVLVGTEYAIEIPSSMADNTVAISVDDIMEHSTVTTYGASGSLIGEKDYTYTREPKGKMTAYYDVYTVQNFNSRDHYIIKANVTGMPGCDLGGAYETKLRIAI